MKHTISYLVGALVLFPLLLYGVNKIFFSAREVTEDQVNKYVKNSLILEETVNEISYEEYQKDKSLGYQIEYITHFLSRTGKGKQQYYGYIYFSQQYQKYIYLIVIVEGGGVIDRAIDSPEIELTVNREDWESPLYGTKENPVPVLKFTGVDRSLREDNLDYDKAYMDDIYRRNVEMYLKHILPKKEFKERFGK